MDPVETIAAAEAALPSPSAEPASDGEHARRASSPLTGGQLGGLARELAPRFDALELDLEVFHGPFDLLLELVMREEVDLLEVDLAQVVLGYIELLEARGEFELEPVTEFVVLVAALLELKSRLMLPGEDDELAIELELDSGLAAEELVARLLEYHRYNRQAGWLRERYDEERPFNYRSAPLPRHLRDIETLPDGQLYNPERLSKAIGRLLSEPEQLAIPHMRVHRTTLEQRLAHVRGLLQRAVRIDFDDAVAGADRVTEALTIWALLELYKLGEADWQQQSSFGPIEILAPGTLAA